MFYILIFAVIALYLGCVDQDQRLRRLEDQMRREALDRTDELDWDDQRELLDR